MLGASHPHFKVIISTLPIVSGHFLFIDYGANETIDDGGRYALALSPVYRNSGPNCHMFMEYYIAGDIGCPAIIVGVLTSDQDGFAIDFLHPTTDDVIDNGFHSRIAMIGRREGDIRVLLAFFCHLLLSLELSYYQRGKFSNVEEKPPCHVAKKWCAV